LAEAFAGKQQKRKRAGKNSGTETPAAEHDVSLIGVKSMKITIDDHTNKPAGEFLGKVPTDLTSPALVRVAETRADGCSGRFQAE
jgi:hypothetical protein